MRPPDEHDAFAPQGETPDVLHAPNARHPNAIGERRRRGFVLRLRTWHPGRTIETKPGYRIAEAIYVEKNGDSSVRLPRWERKPVARR